MPPSWERFEVTLAPTARGEDLALASECGVRVAAHRDPTQWQMVRSALDLELHAPLAMGNLRLELSLSRGPLARRLRTARPDEPLPRAIGLPRRQVPPRVVDATAGLCRDALLLAHLGCTVTAIERIPAFVMLARSAILHSTIARRLRVIGADARAWLDGLTTDERPDVVYLDPMFADEGRAQVKKDMQLCRALAGPPQDVDALFASARAAARERVVVKRHPDAAPLAAHATFVVEGERVRFDVYLTEAISGTPRR